MLLYRAFFVNNNRKSQTTEIWFLHEASDSFIKVWFFKKLSQDLLCNFPGVVLTWSWKWKWLWMASLTIEFTKRLLQLLLVYIFSWTYVWIVDLFFLLCIVTPHERFTYVGGLLCACSEKCIWKNKPLCFARNKRNWRQTAPKLGTGDLNLPVTLSS